MKKPSARQLLEFELVRNSDQRLDDLLRAVREATQPGTEDRQVLVAHLEKFMDKLGISVPHTPRTRRIATKLIAKA